MKKPADLIPRNNYFLDFLNDCVQDLDVTDQTDLIKAIQKINALLFSEYAINKKLDPDDHKAIYPFIRVYADMVMYGLKDFIDTECE